MYRTSDPRHIHNRKVMDNSRTVPIVEVNPDKVSTRRRIEDIEERLAAKREDPLYG
ncbi:hypothetical protein [Vibrio fluvialis]|uniref:hypothetical protein n=1 Tax=Vibrio fluvialis TaxID=676 RepID=UPI0023A9D14A|nr:hypothetical protein [Vibrio fluvialis]MDE5179921.1 hypothetical protein [Vibrio fluvialis]